jgi:hypothetical protein
MVTFSVRFSVMSTTPEGSLLVKTVWMMKLVSVTTVVVRMSYPVPLMSVTELLLRSVAGGRGFLLASVPRGLGVEGGDGMCYIMC